MTASPSKSRARTIVLGVAGTIAAVGIVLLVRLLDLQYPAFQVARQITQSPESQDAVDGSVLGAAVRFEMVYQVAAVGLVVLLLGFLAFFSRRLLLQRSALLGLAGYGLVACFIGSRTSAPVLVVAGGISVALFLFLALSSVRGYLG